MKRFYLSVFMAVSCIEISLAQQPVFSVSDTAITGVLFSDMEKRMIAHGLVNIQSKIPDVILDIRYASENNFMGVNVYGDFSECYLQPDVVVKFQKADSLLKLKIPGWKFVVYDCARPVSVQKQMWNTLKMPASEKGKYVSNPANLSVHNMGAAVDLGLADEKGIYADMGTEFDYFGELAYPYMENTLMKTGKLTSGQVSNRKLLREVMNKAGFTGVPHEWWHFNSCSREIAKSKYRAVE